MKTISSKVVKKFITRSPSLLSPTASLTSIASFNVSNKAFPSSLLDDFAKFCYQRDLPRAMQALELMHTHCIWADCIAYSELIKCCLARRAIQHGKRVHVHLFSNGHVPKDVFNQHFDQHALEFLVLMQREGVRPNMFTYSSVLRACDGLFNLRQLHCCIIKIGLDSDVFVRSALIDVYSRWGQLENALRVFDEMVTGDLVVWSSIIAGLAQNSDGDEALRLFKRMKRAGFLAQQPTLTSVLRACTGLALLELGRQVHVHVLNEINIQLNQLIYKLMGVGYVPDTNFVLQDLEGEQMQDSLRYHSEKLAIVYGLMSLPGGQTIRIRKNLRICGDCHLFAKLVAKMEQRIIVIRDPVRYHHFQDGVCSCGDFW
ncbi:hypothetical protein OIU78_001459 [Salix suchowensis]|nr:hypothetical protein OIU78_001459 [Salix suchowensis]